MENPGFKFGWIPDLPDRDFKFALKALAPAQIFPSSKMLAWVPGDPFTGNVYDQKSIGSCVSNAVGSMIQYCRIQQHHPLNSHSRLFNYYCAREMQGWQGFDSGAYIRDGIKVTVKFGMPEEAAWPYDISRFTEKPPQSAYDSAIKFKSLVYYRLDPTLEAIKSCLFEGFPFVTGFSVFNDFPWGSTDGVVNMPGRGTFVIGGHAVLIIGWDDGAQRIYFPNSWGKGWGKLGRGSLPYEYLKYMDDLWTIRLVE